MIQRMGRCEGVLVSHLLTDPELSSFLESDFPLLKIIDVDEFLVGERGEEGVDKGEGGERDGCSSFPSPSTTILYYMFTSGSTSLPKLTAHSHSSSLSRLLSPHPHCALFPSDIVSHKTSLLFVDSIAETMGILFSPSLFFFSLFCSFLIPFLYFIIHSFFNL